MELPHLGQHCSESSCKQLDFLPFKCDSCLKIFCKEHFKYDSHSCTHEPKQKDFQIPLCPLCNQPVSHKRNELPDIAMSAHIDNDCKSDTRKKIYSNKCSLKGCKNKELISLICSKCNKNYCLKHRHETDHSCTHTTETSTTSNRNNINAARLNFFEKRNKSSTAQQQQQRSNITTFQNRDLSDEDALQMAIQMSLNENKSSLKNQNSNSNSSNDTSSKNIDQQNEEELNNSNNNNKKQSCLLS